MVTFSSYLKYKLKTDTQTYGEVVRINFGNDVLQLIEDTSQEQFESIIKLLENEL